MNPLGQNAQANLRLGIAFAAGMMLGLICTELLNPRDQLSSPTMVWSGAEQVLNGHKAEWQKAPFEARYAACWTLIRQRLPDADERTVGFETARLYSAMAPFYRDDRPYDEDVQRVTFRDLAGVSADAFLQLPKSRSAE